MSPRLKVRIGITVAMTAFTLSGSAANLWHIADKAHMVPYIGALSLIAALDGLALVAALTVHDDRRNPWGWLALVVGTLGSAALQYAATEPIPGDVLIPIPGTGLHVELLRALHSVPTLATLLTAHLTITALPTAAASVEGEQAAGTTGTDAAAPVSVATRPPETPAAPPLLPAAGPLAEDGCSALPRRAALDTGGGPGDRDSVVVVPPADTPRRRAVPDAVAVAELAVWLDGRAASKRQLLKGAEELGIALGSSRAERLAPLIDAHQEDLTHAPQQPALTAVPDRHLSA